MLNKQNLSYLETGKKITKYDKMKYIILISLLISCEKLDFKKYVIITPEGRIVCDKQIDNKNYTDCVNDYSREEKISSVYSGGSVVLEIEKE